MQLIYARHPFDVTPSSIFLAGPTPRSKAVRSWRPDAICILTELKFQGTVFVPEDPESGGLSFKYEEQIRWEWQALEEADRIVFWIPRDLQELPGFTTNVEFGLYCQSGKILLGHPKSAPKMRYLQMLAERFNVPTFHDLASLLQSAIDQIESFSSNAERDVS